VERKPEFALRRFDGGDTQGRALLVGFHNSGGKFPTIAVEERNGIASDKASNRRQMMSFRAHQRYFAQPKRTIVEETIGHGENSGLFRMGV
jgi:hypothetical protein